MVQQMSLASSPYPKGVDEFIKTGFTPIESELVKPYRVKESPVQLECTVENVIELGQGGGAGNLIICKVVKIHIDENMMNEAGQIDQTKIDLVARMGGDWYCRANGDAIFELQKPLTTCGIGVDILPENVRLNDVFTGNDLGILGNIESIPSLDEQNAASLKYGQVDLHKAQKMIRNGEATEALAWLWNL
jgi:hypothetical protein